MRTAFLFVLTLLLISGKASSQDTLIKFGSNLSGAPQWKYLGGGNNLDQAAWKSLNYNETGWITAKSSFGFGSSTPSRNTSIPENNTAGGGGTSTARYPTLYFRKILNIASPSSYANYKVRVKFDDAIVVWINGVEAYRYNIPADPAYTTLADYAITNNGSDMYAGGVSSSLFVPGNNIIAVEIHQASTTSSDMYFDLELIGYTGIAASVARNPYLQMGNQTATTIRWKTDIATNSRVRYGTTLGSYTSSVDSTSVADNHEVRISGLTPDTKYYYEIGEFSGANYYKLQGDSENYFTTLPTASTTRKIRIVAFGDCGQNPNSNQTNTLNAYRTFVGAPGKAADALLFLGDNAYDNGNETDYTNNFFNAYGSTILKNHKMYPVPGNHEYDDSDKLTTSRSLAYYNNFSLPTAGECGGIPSGTESYYSYDIGNIHMIAMDSYGREGKNKMYDTLGAQATWLKADLAANTKKWVIAYWHHPPYTAGSHNSDTETELEDIRKKFITILERYGVDLVICGHSHAYERSYLLKGFYTSSNTFVKSIHAADSSSAKYDGSSKNSCPYTYSSGKINHGTVYVVTGCSGALATPGELTSRFDSLQGSHPFSFDVGGSFIIDVQGNRLDAKFIQSNLKTTDRFTIMKDVKTVKDTTINVGQSVKLSASWLGAYNWIDNGGVTTSSVTVTPAIGSYVYRVVDSTGTKTCLTDSFNVVVSLVSPISWTGNVSTVWENAANWSSGTLPDVNTDVVINSGRPNYPQLNSNTSIRSIKINPGASLIIKTNFKLTVLH